MGTSSVFKKQWERDVTVLFINVLSASPETSIFISAQEVPLNFLSPLDMGDICWLFPAGIKPQPVHKLSQANSLDDSLLFHGAFEALEGTHIAK